MLAHDGSLYLFGGIYPKYGPTTRPADLTTMGPLNDLWRFSLKSGEWHEVEPDDGQAGFDPESRRPCGRVLPCWVEAAGKFYLFGGLTVLGAGWKMRLLNDLWCFDSGTRRWKLLEADDGRLLMHPEEAGARPNAVAAMGTAVIGDRIFMFSGWGGDESRAVLSSQLWSFDVGARTWTLHGRGDAPPSSWPKRRYCPAVTAFEGKLYLWSGRDSEDRAPQYYDEVWSYDPAANEWSQLVDRSNDAAQHGRPRPRYAMGEARIGHHWYIFGGFGGESGNSPQLNDLWRLNLRSGRWTLMQPHDGSKSVGPAATRPCVRRVPAMTAAGDKVYIFGGFDLTSGPDEQGPLIGFNDLWQGKKMTKPE